MLHLKSPIVRYLLVLSAALAQLSTWNAFGASPDETPESQLRSQLERARQASPARCAPSPPTTLEAIYAPRGFAPLWVKDGKLTPQAAALLKILNAAEDFGLSSRQYTECLPAASTASSAAGTDPSQPNAELDVQLTSAVARFITHVHYGRVDPRKAGFDLGNLLRPPLPLIGLLTQLSTAPDVGPVIASAEPPFLHYELLKRALIRYRQLASGQASPTPEELLTAPYDKRVHQIELTLERWRWLPAFTTPPILVNIPQFRLFAFRSTHDHEADILQMDVIVGRTYPKTQTPVFAADLKYVVFRPYWDIPSSILRNEMLPAIRSKPGYMRAQRLEMVAGQSDNSPVVPETPENLELLAAGKLRLRQRPGEDNALGLVKFMLPNSYNVYLHSTPAHHLFAQSRRAFSHGCIRVKEPAALAEFVLRNTPGNWTKQSVEAAMNGETNSSRVNLTVPIRVMILYGTALATERGPVRFFDDIYGHDRRLDELLAN